MDVLRLAAVPFVACLLTDAGFGQLAVVRQGRESRGGMETADRHGSALAVGDFNGDGYDDVACGSPYEAINQAAEQNGAVVISFGGPYGLTWEGAEILLAINQPFVQDTDEAWFGFALAAGDLNDDGLDELVVGAPRLDWNGVADTGGVYVYIGGAGTGGAALQGQTPLVLDQSSFSAAPESGDEFGAALWVGPIDDDSFDDLLIGGPGENLAAGAIYGGYGSANTLVPDASLTISAQEAGAAAGANDGFGTRILVADVARDGRRDLVVSAPFEDFGSFLDAGAVYVIPMGATEPLLAGTFQLEPNDWGLPRQHFGWFGMGIAAGEFDPDADATLDLAIGAPGENNGEGQVYVMNGSPTTPDYVDVFDQSRSFDFVFDQEAAIPEPGDHFGWSLAVGDFDDDGLDDLAVGSPGETLEDFDGDLHENSGAVTILLDHPVIVGASPNDQNYTEPDLSSRPLGNARTGEVLAVGDNDDDPADNLFVGAPGWNVGTGQFFDVAPWRQVYGLTGNGALAAGCEETVYYALRPFDQERTASTAKIMTTLLACEAAQLPPGDPDHVPLSTEYEIPTWLDLAFDVTGCSSADFADAELVTMETILRLVMMISANDGTYAVADLMGEDIVDWIDSTATVPQFLQLMNDRADELDMIYTDFTNPSGIDTFGNYTTTYDMFLLLKEAMANPLFEDFASTTEYTYDRLVPNPFGPGYDELDTITTYGWLTSLQELQPLTIAGKPGSTSVYTRAAAARQEDYPWGLVYGLVYGVPKEQGGEGAWRKANKETAAMLTLGLALCDPTITVNDFDLEPDLTPPVTVDDATLDFPGDQQLFCIEMTDRPVGALDDPVLDEFVIEFDAGPGDEGEVQTEMVALTLSKSMEFNESTTWGVHDYQAHDGIRIGNPDPLETLCVSIQLSHPPIFLDANIPPMGEFLVPPDASGNGTETFTIIVTSCSAAELVIQIDPVYISNYEVGPGADSTIEITTIMDPLATRSNVCLKVTAIDDASDLGEFSITVQEPGGGAKWGPCLAEERSYGAGWPGELGVPPLTVDQAPAMGEVMTLEVGSSSTLTRSAVLVLGLAPLAFETEFGGSLLVNPSSVVPIVLPATGLDIPIYIPIDAAFCGVRYYWQLAVADPLASGGLSFSRGLEAELGD